MNHNKPNTEQGNNTIKKKILSIFGLCVVFAIGILQAFVSPEQTTTQSQTATQSQTTRQAATTEIAQVSYTFRNDTYLTNHFKNHGGEMGVQSEQEYLAAANAVIANPNALHKLEAEDNDHIYYIEDTNEIVFVSQDGYIRTYFICSGMDYYNRQ